MKKMPLLCATTVILCTAANAAGVKDKKRWKEAVSQVDTVRVEAEKSCGISLGFSFDKESFGSDLAKLDDVGMDGYCGDAFTAMADLCGDDDYREAMAPVKSLSCAYDESLEKPNVSLADGTLGFTFNWDTANHEQTVEDFLEDNL